MFGDRGDHGLELFLLGEVVFAHLAPKSLFEVLVLRLVIVRVEVFEDLERVVAEILDAEVGIGVDTGLFQLILEVLEEGFDVKALFDHNVVEDSRIFLREGVVALDELGLRGFVHLTLFEGLLKQLFCECDEVVFLNCVGSNGLVFNELGLHVYLILFNTHFQSNYKHCIWFLRVKALNWRICRLEEIIGARNIVCKEK